MAQETAMVLIAVLMANTPGSSSTLEIRIEEHHKKLLREPVNNLYETVDSVAGWIKQLPKAERDIFEREIMPRYLSDKWTEAYAIMLCGVAGFTTHAPALLERLNAHEGGSSGITHLIMALGRLRYEPAYGHLKQHLSSEHSFLVLESLARINFKQTVPYLNEAFNKKGDVWRRFNDEELESALSDIFTDLFYDVGPKGALDYLAENADTLRLDLQFAKQAFADAFEFYIRNGRRIVQPKRAHYYIKQVPRILTGGLTRTN